jgi:hypothetical protein
VGDHLLERLGADVEAEVADDGAQLQEVAS